MPSAAIPHFPPFHSSTAPPATWSRWKFIAGTPFAAACATVSWVKQGAVLVLSGLVSYGATIFGYDCLVMVNDAWSPSVAKHRCQKQLQQPHSSRWQWTHPWFTTQSITKSQSTRWASDPPVLTQRMCNGATWKVVRVCVHRPCKSSESESIYDERWALLTVIFTRLSLFFSGNSSKSQWAALCRHLALWIQPKLPLVFQLRFHPQQQLLPCRPSSCLYLPVSFFALQFSQHLPLGSSRQLLWKAVQPPWLPDSYRTTKTVGTAQPSAPPATPTTTPTCPARPAAHAPNCHHYRCARQSHQHTETRRWSLRWRGPQKSEHKEIAMRIVVPSSYYYYYYYY